MGAELARERLRCSRKTAGAFFLEKRGAWIAAAGRQIATKACSRKVGALQPLASHGRISNDCVVE